MVNVCVDGNFIFHKTFGIFAGYGNVDPAKILGDKRDQSSFIRKISTDLCSSLKLLPAGGRMIFTADSRSWRRKIEIENGGYKSGRVRDETVDWTIFFDLLSSFGKHLEEMGFIFSKVDSAEGDDLLMYWSDHFMSSNENCIIVTGDKDLHQLAKTKNGSWTIIWNSSSKNNTVWVPPGWENDSVNQSGPISIFNMGSVISPEKEKLKSFIKKVEIEEVDVRNFILIKILIGDKGDSVPSVWEYENSGKITKFTQKKAESVVAAIADSEFSDLSISELRKNESFLNWASGLILRTSKDVDSTINREKVAKNILRNFQLMWLDRSVFPDNLNSDCLSEIKRGLEKTKKNITLDRIKLLEGTDWVSSDYHPKGFDPFENLLK
jgi:5'-3' exonuclease